MKFFLKPYIYNKEHFLKQKTYKASKTLVSKHFFETSTQIELFQKSNFFKFFCKHGLGLKNRLHLNMIAKNLTYFFFFKKNFIFENHQQVAGVLENMLNKKLNFNFFFMTLINLLKSPFIVKSISVAKKLKKRTKKRYITKIIYSNDLKRTRNTYKQLMYYSNDFLDTKFNIRLYKSLMFSFLEWKNSQLYKLKVAVFKKYFKF